MKTAIAKIVTLFALVAALTLPLSACKTTGTGPGPTPVPIVNGAVDCLAPSFFQIVSFATLVPLAEHAIAQGDPIGALTQLVLQYGEAEVDCVAAYLNDLATAQAAASPTNPVVKTRASVTAQWLARETAKGVGPVVNYGAIPGAVVMPEFALTAEDGCVPLDVLEYIAAALDLQMRRDVAPIYDTSEPWTVGALPSLDGLRDAPGVRKVLTFRRKLGVAGALGFHTQRLGVEYAEALVPRWDSKRIDGATPSHEVIETFGDPACDQSWPMPDGSMVDNELSDPVEADAYDIPITLGRETRIVAVSNFVTPAWFQIPGTELDRRFDFLGKLTAPFTMTAGGYYRVVDISGAEDYVFADQAARARVAAKRANATSRVARRAR